jgi:rSAM/selenodomain-associated transferase 1
MHGANPEAPAPTGIAILARAPVPGRVKTRLIPLLGAQGASALQAWMLRRTVATALAAGLGPVTLCCDGDLDHPDILRCRELGPLGIRPQAAGDLGRRMLAAIEDSTTAGGTLVIGTDCPVLGAAQLRAAALDLARRDAVLVPAEDGGYVLIGMKAPAAAAFAGIAWGGPQVMAQTRQALAALGWRWTELATLWDVDRAEDVERLVALFPELATPLGLRRDLA